MSLGRDRICSYYNITEVLENGHVRGTKNPASYLSGGCDVTRAYLYPLHTSTAINIYFSAYFTDSLRGRGKIVMIHTYTYTDHFSNILGCRVYCTYILLLFQIYRLTGQFMISLTPVAYRLLSLVIFKLLTHLFMLLEKKIIWPNYIF